MDVFVDDVLFGKDIIDVGEQEVSWDIDRVLFEGEVMCEGFMFMRCVGVICFEFSIEIEYSCWEREVDVVIRCCVFNF